MFWAPTWLLTFWHRLILILYDSWGWGQVTWECAINTATQQWEKHLLSPSWWHLELFELSSGISFRGLKNQNVSIKIDSNLALFFSPTFHIATFPLNFCYAFLVMTEHCTSQEPGTLWFKPTFTPCISIAIMLSRAQINMETTIFQ